ncbi:ribonuclease H-like domain-containing protein, partial [Lipomyces starkeyi]
MFADSSTNKSDGSTGKYRQHLMLHTIKNSAASRQSVLDIGHLLKGRPNKPLAAPMSSDVTAIVEANIVKWMVATSKPFTEVESDYFRAIFNNIPGLGPLFKSASTATTRILELYMSQKSELKAELATTSIAVSISIDGWTSPTKSAIFAIIAHWITEEWEAREAVLHITELQGSHTGLALAEEVLRCLRFYDITKKLIAVSSDNASNNATMIDALEELIMNPSAQLNEDSDSELSTDGRLSDDDETYSSRPARESTNINHEDNSLRTIIYAPDSGLSADHVIQEPGMVPTQPLFHGRRSWVRCIAHSLNLIVKAFLQRLDFDVGQNIDNDDVVILKPNKIVSKIRRVAKSISNETQSREYWLKLVNKYSNDNSRRKVIPYDVTTRWNSTYYMLDGAYELKRVYDKFTSEKMQSSRLSREEWQVVGDMQTILRKFENWTLMASGNYTVSSMWPILNDMDMFFQSIAAVNGTGDNVYNGYSEACIEAIMAAKEKFDVYHERYLSLDLYEVAMSLDPELKLSLISDGSA